MLTLAGIAPALVVGLSLAVAWAGPDGSTKSDPSQDRRSTTGPTTQPDRDGDRDRDRRDGPGWQEPTSEEWERAVAFLRENSPQRLEIYEQAVSEWRATADNPEELPRGFRRARTIIYGRVEMLRHLEERDPELYAFALDQFRLEDQIISHLRAARQAARDNDEAAEARAREAASEAIRRYAEGTLSERESRIDRLRRELSREERRLEQDRENFDKLVERLQERFERSLPGGDRGRGSGRGGDRDGDRDGRSGDDD